jgi:hypothetical protein
MKYLAVTFFTLLIFLIYGYLYVWFNPENEAFLIRSFIFFVASLSSIFLIFFSKYFSRYVNISIIVVLNLTIFVFPTIFSIQTARVDPYIISAHLFILLLYLSLYLFSLYFEKR